MPHRRKVLVGFSKITDRALFPSWYSENAPNSSESANETVMSQKEKLWGLFHRLWTKAVGTKDYIKEDWMDLEQLILYRAKN